MKSITCKNCISMAACSTDLNSKFIVPTDESPMDLTRANKLQVQNVIWKEIAKRCINYKEK